MQILTGGDEMEFIKIIVSIQSSLLVKHLKINTITYVFEFHINIYQVRYFLQSYLLSFNDLSTNILVSGLHKDDRELAKILACQAPHILVAFQTCFWLSCILSF